MSTGPADPRLRQVHWRDLVGLAWWERCWELTLWVPWLVVSLWAYRRGWVLPGAALTFFFFLTGLRLSHNAQHRCLGIGRGGHDAVLLLLSVLMLASMHAVRATHLHHHRHCLDEYDIEAGHARERWWRVLFTGPLFPLKLHAAAWRIGDRATRVWIVAELLAAGSFVAMACLWPAAACLRWHFAGAALGECMTGFFAVWIVHRGCDPHHQIARTQRGWLKNVVSYSMFYHLEHHLFPAIPTCHLPRLAERLDQVAPEYRRAQVI
jgi:fatty acid desaturase